MGRPGFMTYFDWRGMLGLLTMEELGQMYTAIMDYAEFGVLPEFAGRDMNLLWRALRPKLDADQLSYETKVEKSRKAAKAKWDRVRSDASAFQAEETETERDTETEREREMERETERETEITYPTTTTTGFTPPSIQDVDRYCIEQHHYAPLGEKFVAYYNDVGWKIGKRPMQDWKKAVDWWNEKEISHAIANGYYEPPSPSPSLVSDEELLRAMGL